MAKNQPISSHFCSGGRATSNRGNENVEDLHHADNGPPHSVLTTATAKLVECENRQDAKNAKETVGPRNSQALCLFIQTSVRLTCSEETLDSWRPWRLGGLFCASE
jgi:hypothetical protein